MSAVIKMNPLGYRKRIISLLLFAAMLIAHWSISVQAANGTSPTVNGCTAAAKETDGIRRLALLIGVGKYKNPRINQLDGPPGDVSRMYELLTGPGGYGFPRENVCQLIDEQATMAGVRSAFDQALVGRAKSKDVIVIYFSGHGSITEDINGDEGDGNDETLVLHDSRTGDVGDLVDDDFNELLGRLHAKTENITVVLDSCNSGTAARGDVVSLIPRYQEPFVKPVSAVSTTGQTRGDGGEVFSPKDLPGLVLLSAAADGTSAMETGGRGIFTDALLEVFSKAPRPPLTYAQASYQVRPLVASRSPQVPFFHGDLSKTVFGNEKRVQPMGLRVASVGPPLELSGPPLPGLGKNAEMRIYDGKTTEKAGDPLKAKATVTIDSTTGLASIARIVVSGPNTSKIEKGDLAVLVRPADVAMKVRLRPESKPGGIPKQRADAVRKAVAADKETSAMVEMVDSDAVAADFELSLRKDGKVVLRDERNQIRNVYAQNEREPAVIAQNLWQHARQRGLIKLAGEGGNDFKDNQTLKVSLMPESEINQHACAKKQDWLQAEPNEPQNVPLCFRYFVKVELAKDSPVPLLVGGVLLSSDGGIYGFEDMLKEPLQPGASKVFKKRFYGSLPIDIADRLIVFGTQAKNQVQWDLLTSPVDEQARARGGLEAASRATDEARRTSSLHRAVERYLVPGTRGVAEDQPATEDTTWTRSSIDVIVRANSAFAEPAKDAKGVPNKKEYTIANFDIRPYLPDDTSSALYKVLRTADALASYAGAKNDGVGYKQHDWKEATVEANLKKGIDCSRSIWFAFTQSGLPYNKQINRYLTTADMVAPNNAMKDYFDGCQGTPPELGDIIVYRDDTKGDGHVVMVIDPLKRIGWGSHGWDGNAKELDIKPDTGVEYQLIKYKKNWDRWDRTTMTEKACWRYRQFAQEKSAGGGPGVNALSDPCDSKAKCNRVTNESFTRSLKEPIK